jgi:hypothetical protein
MQAGIDFSHPEMSVEDIERLRARYIRVPGEIPPHVEFMARHSPAAVKAHSSRFESCVRVFPKQSLALTLLGFDALRGSGPGIRENLLLCRAFGVTKAAAIAAVVASLEYGGADNIDLAVAAAGDVIDSWE